MLYVPPKSKNKLALNLNILGISLNPISRGVCLRRHNLSKTLQCLRLFCLLLPFLPYPHPTRGSWFSVPAMPLPQLIPSVSPQFLTLAPAVSSPMFFDETSQILTSIPANLVSINSQN